MKMHYKILSCLAVAMLTVRCSSAQLSFDELIKDVPSELSTKTYSSSKMNYSISILNELKFVEKEYADTIEYEMFLDTTMLFEEGASALSIIRYNSEIEATLEKTWNKLISNRVLIEDFRIHSKGSTDFLSMPAYYENSACTISKKNTESISFLFRGNSSDFYVVSISVNTEEGYPDNMKKLLYCVKSMKIIP